MRIQKSLLILHAVQQECLNIWICLCCLVSLFDTLSLEIEALAVVGRRIGCEALLGEDQVADFSCWGEHVCLLHVVGQNVEILQRNDYVHLLVNPMMSVGYEWMDWSGNLRAGYTKNIGS